MSRWLRGLNFFGCTSKSEILFISLDEHVLVLHVCSALVWGSCWSHLSQTEQFLGRKLSKRLRIMRARKTAMPHEGVAGKREESESASGDADVVEVLGRERREVQAFDLEVLDDRDLYQHLLKVSTELRVCSLMECFCGAMPESQ